MYYVLHSTCKSAYICTVKRKQKQLKLIKMKTAFYHPQAEIMEKVKRFLFYMQLTFICLVLPALFLIGIRGNDHHNNNSPATEQIYHIPQNGQALVDFRPILSDEQG